jgi:hypothetical protein
MAPRRQVSLNAITPPDPGNKRNMRRSNRVLRVEPQAQPEGWDRSSWKESLRMVRLGSLLRRTPLETEKPDEAPAPPTYLGPPLIVLIPDVAGVSSFRMYGFHDTEAAARFIKSLPRPQRERAHAFWALQDEPTTVLDGDNATGEATVLIRASESSDLVYVVSFVDIESAQSFARFEVKRGMHLGLMIVYWASMVNVLLTGDGVQLIPELPPTVSKNGRRRDRPDALQTKRQRHSRSEVRRLQAEAEEEKKRLQAELVEMERLQAEAEELKRLQAEAAEKRRLQAEVEERRRVLKTELDEVKRLRAEAEAKRKELAAQAEENAREGQEARKWLQAEAEEKKRLQEETQEMKRLQAELEETRRLGTEAAAKRQLQLEQELAERLRAEEEAKTLLAEAETQRRLAEAAEEQRQLQAELQEIEQRRVELLQRQHAERISAAEPVTGTPEIRVTLSAMPESPVSDQAADSPAEEQRRLAAEAEEQRPLKAGTEERRRLEAETADEQRRVEAEAAERRFEPEADEQRRLEAKAEEQRRLAAEAEEQRRLAAEAEEQRRLEAEAEDKRRLAAEAEEQRRVEAEAEDKRRLAEQAEEWRRQGEAEERLRREEEERARFEAEAQERLRAAAEAQAERDRAAQAEMHRLRLAMDEEQRRAQTAGQEGDSPTAEPRFDREPEESIAAKQAFEPGAEIAGDPGAGQPNAIEELLKQEAQTQARIPSQYAREPADGVDPAEEEDAKLADEVSKILRRRRWEKRENPFEGFNSPPGRF